MSELNTRQEYCRLRRKGYSDAVAAERAGFAGRPGPDARRLWDVVQDEAGKDLAERRVELEQRVSRLEFELERTYRRLEALQVLQCE